jgi:peptidyl-prolyl cis-trans isomerase SurA
MRSESTISSFVNELKKDYNYTDNAQKLLPMFYNTMGDDIYLGKWKGLEDQSHASDILFSFADRVITIQDFESYIIRNQKKMPRQDLKAYVKGQFNRLVQEEIIAYEDLQLERKYPEFKSLITEYSDGILVFEIMQNEIWKKASKDTTGIRLFYESNKDQFTFPLRYKGDLYTCNDKKTAKLVNKMVKAKELAPIEIEEALNENSQLNVKAKTQTFSSEGTAAFEVEKKGNKQVKTFKQGLNKAYKNNELYYVFNVEEVLEPRNREFSESKGLVTAAYQAKLEKDWLSSLRQQYKIEIKKDVLYGLGTDK